MGALLAFDIDDPVAGEELFGFGEDAIGDGFAVFTDAHDDRLFGVGETFCGTSSPASRRSLLRLCMKAMWSAMAFLGHVPISS